MKNYSHKTNQKVTRYRTPSSFRVMKPMAQRPLKAAMSLKHKSIKALER